MQETDQRKQSLIIKRHVLPLLSQLLASFMVKEINVTRMNIATTNFQDVTSKAMPTTALQFSLSQPLSQKRNSPMGSYLDGGTKKVRYGSGTGSFGANPTQLETAGSAPSERTPKRNVSTPAHSQKATPSRDQRIQKSKMKSTRIDNFFFKKA